MSRPAPRLAPGRFADVSAIAAAGPGRFEAEVHPDWTLGGKPNGGYLLAILGRAAEAAGPHPDMIAASAHYLRSPEPGMVSVEAEVLRAGRSGSQVRARMIQRNQACVEALITTSRIDATATPYWDRGLPATGPSTSATVSAGSPHARWIAGSDHGADRGPPGTGFGGLHPRAAQRARRAAGMAGAARRRRLRPGVAAVRRRCLPAGHLRHRVLRWAPTLELTVYIRAQPAPGPVRVLQRAQLITDGRVDETCHIWDRTGRLVAEGTQLAGIRPE